MSRVKQAVSLIPVITRVALGRFAKPSTALRLLLFVAYHFLFWPVASVSADDENTLHDVKIMGGTALDTVLVEENHVIRFAADESFVFIVDSRLVNPPGGKGTPYTWDHDGDPDTPPRTLRLPDGALNVRAALLASERFWDDVCKRAGLPQDYVGSDPMQIWIPAEMKKPPKSHGVSVYWKHIMILYWGHQDVETAMHEYFHMVQGAVWAGGDPERYEVKMNKHRWDFFVELTSPWSEDLPIKVRLADGTIYDPDTANNYLFNGSFAFRLGDWSLFHRGKRKNDDTRLPGYVESLLAKYFSEQCAGGQDPGSPEQLLRWTVNTLADGDATGERILTEMVRLLPGGFGGTPQERWRRFHALYRMSNVVQKAGAAPEHPKQLGYHDDAFQTLTGKPTERKVGLGEQGLMYPVYLGKAGPHRGDYRERPSALYKTSASTAKERVARLRENHESHSIHPQATLTRMIDLNLSQHVEPVERPVFIFVEGDSELELGAYLLSQRTRDADHRGRKTATFKWEQGLNLNLAGATEPRNLERTLYAPASGERMYLWCGLLNSTMGFDLQDARWTYVASPRLLPYVRPREPGRTTPTVELIGGDALDRPNDAGFFNGDRFAFQVDATGPLHLGPLTLPDVPSDQRTLDAQLLGPGGTAVKLADDGLTVIAVKLDDRETVGYTIAGRIAPDNPISGRCKLQLKLTSLLNLGDGDKQIDESFIFQLSTGPRVAHLRVSNGDRSLFDTRQKRHRAAQPQAGAYSLEVEVTFTNDMDPTTVQITAGGAPPFTAHTVQGLEWEGLRTCRGRFRIAKTDAPKRGMLTFSIAGSDASGTALDVEAYRDGIQPDTSNFALLELAEMYRLVLEAQSTREHGGPDGESRAVTGPLRIEYALSKDSGATYSMGWVKDFCEDTLASFDVNNPFIETELARRQQELEAVRKDLERTPQPELMILTMEFEANRETIEEFKKSVGPGYRYLRVRYLALEDDIAALKKGDPHKALVAYLERVVMRLRNEVTELNSERELLLAVLRVANAERNYSGGENAVTAARFAGAQLSAKYSHVATEAEADFWMPRSGIDGELKTPKVQLAVLVADWDDLRALERLMNLKASSPLAMALPESLAGALWQYWPLRDRPAADIPVAQLKLPPLRSNVLVCLRWDSGLSLRLPAYGTHTTMVEGKQEQEQFEGELISRWRWIPESDFKLSGDLYTGPHMAAWLRGETREYFDKNESRVWVGDPFDVAYRGNPTVYGNPVERALVGRAVARFEGDTVTDVHTRIEWTWSWKLHHFGDEDGVRPQARPSK